MSGSSPGASTFLKGRTSSRMQQRSNVHVGTYEICFRYTRFELGAHARRGEKGSFCVVNALCSGKNRGFVYGGRQRRETAVGQLAARATNLWGLLQTQTTMISYTLWHVTYGRFRTMQRTEVTDRAESKKRLVKLSLTRLPIRSFINSTSDYFWLLCSIRVLKIKL